MTEYRCYTLTHFMLSSIQQGIQSGHAAMELVNKYYQCEPVYKVDEEQFDVVLSWIRDNKTIICLNGGNSESMIDWVEFLDTYHNKFPWVTFHEDENSLEGILTSIAIILPNWFYEVDPNDDLFVDIHSREFTAWELELLTRIKSASLAR